MKDKEEKEYQWGNNIPLFHYWTLRPISLYYLFIVLPPLDAGQIGWITKQNSVELEASLAPAEAEDGAVAKADQKVKKKKGCSHCPNLAWL